LTRIKAAPVRPRHPGTWSRSSIAAEPRFQLEADSRARAVGRERPVTYVAEFCPACGGLHIINRPPGKLMAEDHAELDRTAGA